MTTTCIITLIVLVLAVVIGCAFDINLGVLGVVGAYICGVLIAGMKPRAVMNEWPTVLMFQMIFIVLFYSYAKQNGTLDLMARKIIYLARNHAYLIPIALFLVCALIAALGGGAISTVIIMCIPVYSVAKETKINPIFAAVIILTGINAGAWRTGHDGIVATGLMASAGFSAEEANLYSNILLKNYIIISVFIFALAYIIFKGWKCRPLTADKPEPFNKKQKINIVLIVIMVLLYVVPMALSVVISNPVINYLSSNLDMAFLGAVFSLLCIVFKLGDTKEVIKSLPWGTLIVVCGMGMLINVCVDVGLVDAMSNYVASNVSEGLMPVLMGLIAGVMSLFTATIAVVLPTFYPFIHSLTETVSISPALLISAVTICSGFTGISPFSLIGAMCYSACEPEDKKKLFVGLIAVAAASFAIAVIFILTGIISG